jgi:hypothetical protein
VQRRNADGQTRPGHDQLQAPRGLGQHVQVGIVQGVGDGQAHALSAQDTDAFGHRRRAGGDMPAFDQADARLRRLRLQHANQVGVGHRRQRVVAHGAVGQQQVTDEEVALVDRAAVFRKGRRDEREVSAGIRQQGFGHRPDVAGGVESKVEQTLK